MYYSPWAGERALETSGAKLTAGLARASGRLLHCYLACRAYKRRRWRAGMRLFSGTYAHIAAPLTPWWLPLCHGRATLTTRSAQRGTCSATRSLFSPPVAHATALPLALCRKAQNSETLALERRRTDGSRQTSAPVATGRGTTLRVWRVAGETPFSFGGRSFLLDDYRLELAMTLLRTGCLRASSYGRQQTGSLAQPHPPPHFFLHIFLLPGRPRSHLLPGLLFGDGVYSLLS